MNFLFFINLALMVHMSSISLSLEVLNLILKLRFHIDQIIHSPLILTPVLFFVFRSNCVLLIEFRVILVQGLILFLELFNEEIFAFNQTLNLLLVTLFQAFNLITVFAIVYHRSLRLQLKDSIFELLFVLC